MPDSNELEGWVKIGRYDVILFAAAFVMLAITLSLLIVNLVVISGDAHAARVDRQALCTLRSAVVKEIVAGQKFLLGHPNGIPGISASQINQSIAREQITISALSGLNCSN